MVHVVAESVGQNAAVAELCSATHRWSPRCDAKSEHGMLHSRLIGSKGLQQCCPCSARSGKGEQGSRHRRGGEVLMQTCRNSWEYAALSLQWTFKFKSDMQAPHWSRIGRLKRSTFPSLKGGGSVFGGGASPGLLAALAGRLVCDTYLSARELVKEVDYTLKTLARSLLQQERTDLSDVPGKNSVL